MGNTANRQKISFSLGSSFIHRDVKIINKCNLDQTHNGMTPYNLRNHSFSVVALYWAA